VVGHWPYWHSTFDLVAVSTRLGENLAGTRYPTRQPGHRQPHDILEPLAWPSPGGRPSKQDDRLAGGKAAKLAHLLSAVATFADQPNFIAYQSALFADSRRRPVHFNHFPVVLGVSNHESGVQVSGFGEPP